LSATDDLGGVIEDLGTGLVGVGGPIRDESLGQIMPKHDAVDGLGQITDVLIEIITLVMIDPIHLAVGAGHVAIGAELELDFQFAHVTISCLSFALPGGKQGNHLGDALGAYIGLALGAVNPAQVLFAIKGR